MTKEVTYTFLYLLAFAKLLLTNNVLAPQRAKQEPRDLEIPPRDRPERTECRDSKKKKPMFIAVLFTIAKMRK